MREQHTRTSLSCSVLIVKLISIFYLRRLISSSEHPLRLSAALADSMKRKTVYLLEDLLQRRLHLSFPQFETYFRRKYSIIKELITQISKFSLSLSPIVRTSIIMPTWKASTLVACCSIDLTCLGYVGIVSFLFLFFCSQVGSSVFVDYLEKKTILPLKIQWVNKLFSWLCSRFKRRKLIFICPHWYFSLELLEISWIFSF